MTCCSCFVIKLLRGALCRAAQIPTGESIPEPRSASGTARLYRQLTLRHFLCEYSRRVALSPPAASRPCDAEPKQLRSRHGRRVVEMPHAPSGSAVSLTRLYSLLALATRACFKLATHTSYCINTKCVRMQLHFCVNAGNGPRDAVLRMTCLPFFIYVPYIFIYVPPPASQRLGALAE